MGIPDFFFRPCTGLPFFPFFPRLTLLSRLTTYPHPVFYFFFPFSCIQFLDAQRIRNLTSYLQELHEQGVANADHTTLLLNCYTKLMDNERLDAFIKVWHARQTQRWTPRQAWLTVGARTACLPTS